MAVKAIDPTVTDLPPANKVVPLNQFAAEEQSRSTEVGTAPSVTRKPKKGMFPASVLAKAPSDNPAMLTAIAQQIQTQLLTMTAEEQAAVATQVKNACQNLLSGAKALQTVLASHQTLGDSASTQNFFTNTSILMLYEAFAVSQMNQNNNITNGWVAQQQAQNVTLQDAANGENSIANEQTTAKHASGWMCFLIGLGVAIGVALIAAITILLPPVAAVLPVALTTLGAASIGTVVGIGALAGAITGVSCFVAADANPNSSANDGITSSGPSEQKLEEIQSLNTFWSMISQKANEDIQTGSQLDVVNVSSNNTQLGQQASQDIQTLGQVMRTQVNN